MKKKAYNDSISTIFIWTVIILFIIGFTSCSQYTCPSNNGGKEGRYINKKFNK